MSLARVHDPLRPTLIRRLGDAGGPRADDIAEELDSLIAWVRAMPRNIHRDTSTVGNVGAGLDVLHTFSLPANSLQANGDYLHVWYAGDFAANDADKRLVASFGGTAYEDTGLFDLDAAVGWTFDVKIIRLSSTSVIATSQFMANILTITSADVASSGTAGGYTIGRNNVITGLSDLGANAMTMAVSAESAGAANNDVTQNLSIIELTQQ